ncbi:hypothetical protein HMPREF1008_01898, partial [Olsenella sp. oral taxon 809 str. F0356]
MQAKRNGFSLKLPDKARLLRQALQRCVEIFNQP